MPKTAYTKPAKTYAEQVGLLKSRGLKIENDKKAFHLLENLSYYRLSGYWYPMLTEPKTDHIFKAGASFNNGFKLYCFDRELRKFVMGEIEKIEVAIRAQMIYVMSHAHGAFWLNNASLFQNGHQALLDKLNDEFAQSKEEFIKQFKLNYSDNLPPCWMMLEIIPFGSLSHNASTCPYTKFSRT